MRLLGFLFLLLVLNASCTTKEASSTAPLCQSPDIELKKCPEKAGSIFLPRTYTPNAIYVGFSSDSNHFTFIQNLIQILESSSYSPVINILIPRADILEAQKLFKMYFDHSNGKNIHFYPSVSDETMWMQDYFELLTDTTSGQISFVDLPYIDREGELIPSSLSLTCKAPLVAEPQFDDLDNLPGNGDYGGNIEPFSEKILVIGNNMTDTLVNHLGSITSQELVALDVSWLDTGHVDELFSMLPHKKEASACEQTLIYSSPAKAFELLKKADHSKTPKLPTFSYEEIQEDYPDYFECLKDFSSKRCKVFYRANQKYEQIIQNNLSIIQASFKKHHGCEVKTLPFPQLFTPLKTQGEFGDIEDRSVAFNQNSVNNIYFWPNLIMPKQTIPVFHEYLEQHLKAFPYKVHYSNADFVHTLLGGIHCATNVAYACSP